ncbi:embryonal Fyn-associated substrate isoform X2 [Microcaecilia unicolor]|uniref:Embryonal Fyn-associated substrate isoform X2 n=1 Tax=Microcaecilia unicolor TaxID=1415580 RepID=A0A6P7WRG1_9AMPH|nr:embryonal Fyn-associated substrate isoform X2 [Microcaecilia unicolor]
MTQLAKAIYDNAAETAEELSFRKGDIMMVVERDTAGLRGWWLCSLHGRRGIVPGNRVKLLEGTGAGGFHCARRDPGSGHHSPPPRPGVEGNTAPMDTQTVYQVPPRLDVPGHCWEPGEQAADMTTDVYQVPPAHRQSSSGAKENEYLFPDAETEVTGESQTQTRRDKVHTVPPTARICPSTPAVAVDSATQDDTYRVPRGNGGEPEAQRHQEVYDTPSSLLADPSLAGNTYDIPACFSKKVARVTPQTAPSPPPAEEIPEDMYDVPLAFQSRSSEDDTEVYATPSNLKRAPAIHNLYEAPEDVLDCTVEADGGGESSIYDVPALAQEEGPEELCSAGFQRLSISRPPAQVHRPRLPSSESLSRRPLPALPTQLSGDRGTGETAATTCSPPVFIRKGSIQDRPLPPPPPTVYGPPNKEERPQNEYEGIRSAEEYEYVHLKGSERLCPQSGPNPAPQELPQNDNQSAVAARAPENGVLWGPVENQVSGKETSASSVSPDAEDTQLLHFYAGQCQSHYEGLLATIEAFLAAICANQPPRAFVPQGKSVIVAAHKLVFVGDTLSRLAASPGTRAQVTTAGNALCEALKGVVLAAKTAALHYPSSSATQGVTERVTELSRCALDFTALLRRLSA